MKNILILGFGTSGKAVLDFFLNNTKYNCKNIYVIDDNFKEEKIVENVTYISTNDFLKKQINLEFIVKSPGIKFSNPVLVKYQSNTQVINDIELYYLNKKYNTKIIAITGTNGKTSTVTLLNNVLVHAGFKSKVAGNIGSSPLEYLNENLDYIIIELSSFQLMSINKFTTYASFFLNITPDHLDYHTDYNEYLNAKMQIVRNIPTTKNLYSPLKLEISEEINLKEPLKLQIDYEKVDMGLNPVNIELINHFLVDEGISNKYLIEVLNEQYKGIEHRVEYVTTINDVKYYNDSKATNISATSLALSRLNNIILLVGGYDKNEDMSKLNNYLENVKSVIAYGQNKDKFTIDKLVKLQTLNEALEYAQSISQSGDIILLSPASASYDQFKNYEERGNYFKKLVLGEI